VKSPILLARRKSDIWSLQSGRAKTADYDEFIANNQNLVERRFRMIDLIASLLNELLKKRHRSSGFYFGVCVGAVLLGTFTLALLEIVLK
jgi:hypothetical protein